MDIQCALLCRIVILLLILQSAFTSFQIPNTQTILEQQITDSTLHIMSRFFSDNKPTVIQTSNIWSEFFNDINTPEDFLLARVNNKSMSHIVLGPPVGDVSYLEECKGRPGSVILFLTSEAIEQQLNNLHFMMLRLRLDMRNHAAKFLIVSTLIPNSIKEQMSCAGEILNYLWNYFRISDAVVLIPKPKLLTDCEDCFDVITWYPVDQSDVCLIQLNNFIVIDTWSSKKKCFLHGTELYNSKAVQSMEGCVFNVLLVVWPPFVITKKNDKGKHVVSGIFMRILDVVSDVMLINLAFNVYPYTNNDYADIILPVTEHNSYSDTCDYVYPYFTDELTFFIPDGAMIPRWQSLFRCLSSHMWWFVIMSYVLGTLTFLLFEMYGNIKSNRMLYSNVVIVFMNTFCSYLGIGMKENIHSFSLSLFFTLWLFCCMQIYTAYQASLTGFIINPGKYPPITTLEQLQESGFKLWRSFHLDETSEADLDINVSLRCDGTECFKMMLQKHNSAVMTFKTYSQMYVRGYLTSSYECPIIPLKESVRMFFLSIITRIGCMINKRLKLIIQRLVSGGFLEKWASDIAYGHWRLYYNNMTTANDRTTPFSPNHLQGAFYLLIFGIVASSVTFFCEVLMQFKV